jgi:hypothetical protein
LRKPPDDHNLARDGISFLSRRALYYLFADEEFQVRAYIRALRTLEAVYLLTEANHWKCSLTGIAEASGLADCRLCGGP